MNHFQLPNIDDLDPDEMEEAKQLLRSRIRARRKERTDSARQESANAYSPHVLDFLQGSKRAACYVSVNSEPPTLELCRTIADSGIELLLPKLGPRLTRSWGFFRGLDDLKKMAPSRPPEPTGPAFDNSILGSVDAMIIPALAVSRFGERLGQGGGWYDRALKEIGVQTKVGALIYSDEFTHEHLPQNEMDMPVPFVITENGVLHTTAV